MANNKVRKHITEKVLPIKNKFVLHNVEHDLLHGVKSFHKVNKRKGVKYGRRNYTIFQLGKATMLRVSDVLKLKYRDVYDDDGHVRNNIQTKDKKTGKYNNLYLKPCADDLATYRKWLLKQDVQSKWLFPSTTKKHRYASQDKHISTTQFYRIMKDVGNDLGIDYLGTHTMRKTGAYMVYKRFDNIALVMKLLNQSSETVTLRYLGLTDKTVTNALDKVDFG